MALSRDRASDLSRRIAERLGKTGGITLTAERDYVASIALKALLEWDKQLEKHKAEADKRVKARGRRVAEGSREWDLAQAEELERLLAAETARGE